ncbi:unnamed protein product [Calicophoron daubneyi]|uniref:Tumor necrosis factor alpha-induced protein 8-like protein n=1 Tax=Calicophoron daubneyi TaxID=300641 RepID=A0AAV2T7N5_CALDB
MANKSPPTPTGNHATTAADSTELLSIRSLALQLQNKVVSTLPSGVLKFFMDDAAVRLFDNICRVLNIYAGSPVLANTHTKRMVKMNFQLALQSSSNGLSEEESNLSCDFHDRCHQAAEILLRLGRPKRCLLPGVRPSKEKLIEVINEAKDLVLRAMDAHLKEQTKAKFRESVEYFANRDFMYTVLGNDARYKVVLEQIYTDLEDLMDRGLF